LREISLLLHRTDSSGQQFVNSFVCLMMSGKSVLPTDLLNLKLFHVHAVILLSILEISQDIRTFVALNINTMEAWKPLLFTVPVEGPFIERVSYQALTLLQSYITLTINQLTGHLIQGDSLPRILLSSLDGQLQATGVCVRECVCVVCVCVVCVCNVCFFCTKYHVLLFGYTVV